MNSTSSKYQRNISKRIERIASFAEDNQLTFDVCCDHGLIGYSVYEQKNVPKVIFVDQVKHITDSLTKKIEKFTDHNDFEVICSPGEKIRLPDQKVNFIVAGVYANTILQMVEEIPLNRKIDTYIFSPNSHYQHFEEKLSELGVEVVKKVEVTEGGKVFPIYICCGKTE